MIIYEPPQAAEHIPIVDFAGAFSSDPAVRKAVAWEIHKASRETGFFYLTGHGVSAETMEGQLAISRQFFAQALEKKLEIRLANSANMRGYDPIGRQALDADSPPDLKESVVFGRDLGPDHPLVRRGIPFEGPNQWPAGLPGFRRQMETYTAEMIRLGQCLGAMLALSLDLPENYLEEGLAEPNCAVRLLHYPPHPADAAFNQLGAGAHTDWGLLTILLQDNRGGLEVRNTAGAWLRADPVPGAFVINLGDMVPRMTNGLYHSNYHRVLNNVAGTDRYSVATFFNPPFDYVFHCAPTCLRAGEPAPPPCSFGAHIQDMMQRTQAPTT
jgi:isopenicillin N synthase-like dioxygenase